MHNEHIITPNPTAPTIDLIALAADLAAAGWEQAAPHVFAYDTGPGEYSQSYAITFFGGRCEIGGFPRQFPDLFNPIWQNAIDIIRTHTNGATP